MMTPQPGGGAHRRDQGIAQVEEVGDAWWAASCDEAIRWLAALDCTFTADDVVALCGVPDRPNQIGARFRAAVNAGIIRPVGYTLSDRPSRHKGVLRMYRGGRAR